LVVSSVASGDPDTLEAPTRDPVATLSSELHFDAEAALVANFVGRSKSANLLANDLISVLTVA